MNNKLIHINFKQGSTIGISLLVSLILTFLGYRTLNNFNLTANIKALTIIFSFIICFTLFIFKRNVPLLAYDSILQNKTPILSALISGTVLFGIYIFFGVEPFGDATVIKIDLFSQYAPLYMQLYDKITNFDISFYNWNIGGGTPFFGDFFNYLSSPFTAIIFLFKKENISLALSTIVWVKVVLSGFSFSYYLKCSYGMKAKIYAVFGVMYALSGYISAYYWNIMWTDAVIALPLIILGIERLIDTGCGKLYLGSLIYAIYSNYYTGFMLCIISVFYFLFYLIKENKLSIRMTKENLTQIKHIIRKFVFNSLFTGFILAFILIPVFMLLQNSDATSGRASIDLLKFNFNPFQFAASHFSLTEPTVLLAYAGETPLPNVYTSIFSVFLVGLYFFNSKIKTKNKILYFFLLVFFYLSFSYQPLDYIWHGFHLTNDMPYRNAFIYTFFFLTIAAVSFSKFKTGISNKSFIINFALLIFITVIAYVSEEKFKTYALVFTLLIEILYLIWYMVSYTKFAQKVFSYFLVLLTIFDIGITSYVYFNFTINSSEFAGNYDNIAQAVDYVKKTDNSKYRIEMSESIYGTEGNIYNLSSVSNFSSMANADFSKFQWSVGMKGNGINQQCYSSFTPVIDLINSTKYIIQEDSESDKPSSYFYEEYCQFGETVVWKNKYFIPQGIFSNDISSFNVPNSYDPFTVQNAIFKNYTSVDNMFVNSEIARINAHNITIQKDNYKYILQNDNKYNDNKRYIEFYIEVNDDGPLYAHLGYDLGYNATTWKSFIVPVSIYKNNNNILTLDSLTGQIYYLGDFEKGDIVTMILDLSDLNGFEKGYIDIRGISTLNIQNFNEGYKNTVSKTARINYSNNAIKFKLPETKDSCIIYTSVPYEKGWKITDVNSKVSIVNNNGLIAFKILDCDDKYVEARYAPQGLLVGCLVSIFTGIIFIIMLTKKRGKIRDNIFN